MSDTCFWINSLKPLSTIDDTLCTRSMMTRQPQRGQNWWMDSVVSQIEGRRACCSSFGGPLGLSGARARGACSWGGAAGRVKPKAAGFWNSTVRNPPLWRSRKPRPTTVSRTPQNMPPRKLPTLHPHLWVSLVASPSPIAGSITWPNCSTTMGLPAKGDSAAPVWTAAASTGKSAHRSVAQPPRPKSSRRMGAGWSRRLRAPVDLRFVIWTSVGP
mmetsp:Transcript_64178/g.166841  ORF Transcript_64178/g.166841 Transcript_64178/m.166841 type:complete len:215 (-) Transcript_64178:3-647(-)